MELRQDNFKPAIFSDIVQLLAKSYPGIRVFSDLNDKEKGHPERGVGFWSNRYVDSLNGFRG